MHRPVQSAEQALQLLGAQAPLSYAAAPLDERVFWAVSSMTMEA